MRVGSDSLLNQYTILAPLGKGGMGEVFLAQDTKLDRKVALKILPAEFAANADRMSRFVREAKAASALNHPNIITIHEIGESNGTHFIATEFIDGKTLSEYAKVTSLKYKAALKLAIQIASALQEAHEAGIVHRDIKPDNIMVRSNGLVKVLDFGIVKLTETAPANVSSEDATAIKPQATSPGFIIGTANYMSPEQATGKAVDARSDIFSFGVLLYEMVAGYLPFAGDTGVETLAAILHKEPLPLRPEVPHGLRNLIGKCLQKDKSRRYQTISEVGDDLRSVKQELELQNQPERTTSPDAQTELLPATTGDENNPTRTAKNLNDSITVRKSNLAKVLLGGLVVLLVLVGGFFGYKYLSPASKQINSIAVLPFENKSSDPDTDYLSDGLAESLIYRLSQLPDLKVSPTSSVFHYKGKESDPQTVAKELGVDSVLTGRITNRGDSLTLSVNLVDTRNGRSLWGEQYERKMSEMLTTQREIATEITNKLQLKLSGVSEKALTKEYTTNPEAYQLYLKGNYYRSKYTDEAYKKAIAYYQQAIDIDPNYALAYAGIANTYLSVAEVYVPMNEVMPKAKTAVLRALEIDNSLAEAHALLGAISIWYAWDWAAGERELKRAIELDANNAESHHQYGWYFAMTGRLDQAIAEGELAHRLAPLDINISGDLGGFYYFSGRNDDALRQSQKTIEIDPNSAIGYNGLGMAYAAKRQFAEAIAAMEKAHSLDDSPWLSGFRGYVYAAAGKKVEAQKVLEELRELSKRQYVPAYNVAFIYAGLDDKDKAFELLNKGFETHSGLSVLKVETSLSNLRDDPRYQDLLKRMNLPE